MARPLTSDDFPLRAVGPHVYRRTESSPLFTAADDAQAADLALRLNRDDQCYPTDCAPESGVGELVAAIRAKVERGEDPFASDTEHLERLIPKRFGRID